MRCPKCNYISFDHLDNCKKCGNDLQAVKAELGWSDEMPGPIAFFEDKLTTEETVDQGMDSNESDAIVDTIGQTGEDIAFADTELSINMDDDDDGIQLDAMDDMLDDSMLMNTEETSSIEAIEIDQDYDGIALDLGDIMNEPQMDSVISDKSQISSNQEHENISFEEVEIEESLDIDYEPDQGTVSIEEDSENIISMDIANEEEITEIYDHDGFEEEITSEISKTSTSTLDGIVEDATIDSGEEFNVDDDQTLVYEEMEEAETESHEQKITDEEETMLFEGQEDESVVPFSASQPDETIVIELDEGQELVLTDSEESSVDSIVTKEEIEKNIELQDKEDEYELVFDIADDDDEQNIDTDPTLSISKEKMKNIANDIDSIGNNNFEDDDEDFIELLDE